MNYVVTILTEKYLYRVNIEGGIKYTLGSGKKDLFPMSELGIDGQLGMFFNEKKQVLKLTAKTIPLSVKEINEEARLVHICGYPKMEVSFTRDTGEYPESYAIPYECQIHIGRSKKNDIVLNESYVSRNHLLITAEKGRIRIEDLESTYGTYLNGSPVKKAMLKSGDEIDICDLRMICKENRLYFYNLHETPEFKYQKETNHPGMATNIVSTRKGYPIYHRSPRIRESLPVDEVRLSHLPNKPQKFSIRKANFLPLLSSGAMAGASIAMSTFSPAMLAMRAAMMISPVGSLIGNSNKKARKMLDEAGFEDATIAASNDLDEYLLHDLKIQGAAITSWGVGTNLITSKDCPSFGGVYKLAAIKTEDGEFVPKIKLSENTEKITNPGNKTIYRIYDKATGKIRADLICFVGEAFNPDEDLVIFDPLETWKKTKLKGGSYSMRELMVPVFHNGECIYQSPSVKEIAAYCTQEKATLWDETKRLFYPHRVYVDLSDKLYAVKKELLNQLGRE